MINKALAAGDIKIAMGLGVDGLSFANWAMSFGSNALLMMASDIESIKRLDSHYTLLHNLSLLLDGMAWAPLSSQWDYRSTWQRIGEEIFAEELASLN